MTEPNFRRLKIALNLKCDTSRQALDSTLRKTPRTAAEIKPELTPTTSVFIPDAPNTATFESNLFLKRKKYTRRRTIEPDAFNDHHMKSLKRKLTVLEEFGLPNDVEVKPVLRRFNSELSNVLSRKSITMADFWGNKVAQNLLASPKLRQAANTLKHKYLIQNRATEHSLLYPNHPRKMDMGTIIRMQGTNKSNSPIKHHVNCSLLTSTTEPIFHTEKRMKKHRELSEIYQIMKSCDDLYKTGQENLQKLKIPHNETIKIKKLPKRARAQIELFKKHLN
ncbi:unnamed protein product [Blepharisma stoltei]|uniref:Uncharacterized protein n=1 Tax=Blepharisma stoltei TaxID=1481888 RepID=A0AAU9JJQ2_9CILI|nr:unnamed protein product [Blepharisma stoltei]